MSFSLHDEPKTHNLFGYLMAWDKCPGPLETILSDYVKKGNHVLHWDASNKNNDLD